MLLHYGDRKQGEFKCRATVPGRRENTKPGAEMTGSVGEHATDSSQPCRKGAIRGNITALEAAYEEYRTRLKKGEVMGLFGKRKKTESKEKSVRSQRSSGNVPAHTGKPDAGKFSKPEKRAIANGGGYICSQSVGLMMRAAYPDLKVSEGEALTWLTTETIDVAWEHIKGFMMDKLIPLFISRVAEFDPVAGKRLLELYKAEFSDEDVRRHAAWVLGEYGDEKAVEPLIAALGDKNSDVRKAAVEALRKIAPDDPQVKVALAKRDREEREASEKPISSS